MKKISLDGGRTYMSAAQAARLIETKSLEELYADQKKLRMEWWQKIIDCMELDLCLEVSDDLGCCTCEELLNEYLYRAHEDLVIA